MSDAERPAWWTTVMSPLETTLSLTTIMERATETGRRTEAAATAVQAAIERTTAAAERAEAAAKEIEETRDRMMPFIGPSVAVAVDQRIRTVSQCQCTNCGSPSLHETGRLELTGDLLETGFKSDYRGADWRAERRIPCRLDADDDEVGAAAEQLGNQYGGAKTETFVVRDVIDVNEVAVLLEVVISKGTSGRVALQQWGSACRQGVLLPAAYRAATKDAFLNAAKTFVVSAPCSTVRAQVAKTA